MAENQFTHQLDAPIARTSERVLVEIIENIGDDRIMSLVCHALQRAILKLLTSLMNDDGKQESLWDCDYTDIHKFLSVQAIGKYLELDKMAMTPTANVFATQTKNKVI